MATEFPFDVVLRAKAAMQQGINEAMSQLKKFETDAARSASGGGAGGVMGGALEGVLKFGGALAAAKTALLGVQAASEAIHGDFSKAAEVLYRLPFGVGEIVREAKNVFDYFTGAAEQAERLKDAISGRALLETPLLFGLEKSEAEITKRFEDEKKKLEKLAGAAIDDAQKRGTGKFHLAEKDPEREAAIEEERQLRKELARRLELIDAAQKRELELLHDAEAKKAQAEVDAMAEAQRRRDEEAFKRKAAIFREEAEAREREEDRQKAEAESMKRVTERSERAGPQRSFANAVLVGDRFRGLATQREDAGVAAVMRVENAVKDMGAKVQEAIRVGFRDLPRNLPGGLYL